MTKQPLFVCGALAVLTVTGLNSYGAAFQGAAYDGFEYTAGTALDSLNGGTGWNATGDSSQANTTTWNFQTSATTTGTRLIGSSGLDYTGAGYPLNGPVFSEAGNKVAVTSTGGANNVGRQFGQTIDTGSLYFSFLVDSNTASLRSLNLSMYGTSGTSTAVGERFAFGIAGGSNTVLQSGGNLRVSQNGNALSSPGPASPVAIGQDSVHLLIGKVVFGTAGVADDQVTLWVFTGNEAVPSTEPGTPYDSLTTDVNNISGFRLFAGQTQGTVTNASGDFDEIRFGSTYASVLGAVPEPTSVAALLGGLGVLLGIHRRTRASA